MDESEDNMSSEDLKTSPQIVKSKPKKRSLIERELETSLTSRVTSPSINDGTSTSRYGRARRLKTEIEQSDAKKVTTELKSPRSEKSPTKSQSPAYKMHASNSPLRSEPPKVVGVETFLENQIENIYQENISLSRFGSEEVKKTSPSPAKKFPKVYIRKDLIQKRESDESVVFIKNMFSPVKSANKSSSTHLNNILERSSERYSLSSVKQQNGFLDNSSVVKTLDFDCKKKKKEQKETKPLSKSDLFDLEAKCAYQVGDLAWARMGTYPFWPSIVTRDPSNGIFVKKKLFGRIERDVIHVTFFGDNGRRGWIADTMLRKYLGQLEFETTRENFTPEDKKKDPRLYAAFFISEKKQALWNNSVEEAEVMLREPKRLRIDIFNDMLEKSRTKVKQQKSGKISRTDSDVSLSESLYDSLFSEDDGKSDNTERSRNRTRNKSLDVFEVVTACLDNMAAKTGITKIQRQSHMDRWLQKAKSKTPEKTQAKPQAPQVKEEKKETKVISSKKKKSSSNLTVNKPYRLRKSMTESQNIMRFKKEHDYSKNVVEVTDSDHNSTDTDSCKNFAFQGPTDVGIVAPVESSSNKAEEIKKEEIDNDKGSKKGEEIDNDKENKKDEEIYNVKDSKKAKNEETVVNEEDSKAESPKETEPKVNGTCDSSEGENMDEDGHNSIISMPSSPGNDNSSQSLGGAKVSFSLELAAENAMDTLITRDLTISPVYEDSFNDSQVSHVSAIDGSHMEEDEDEEITPKFKPSEKVTAESPDEMTNDNDDSTVSSTEPSYMSVDEDSKPDNESDSQTDNCSLSDAQLTNDSLLDAQNDTDDDSISALVDKKKVLIDTESSSVSLDKLNKEIGDISDITNDVPSKLIEETNLKDDIKSTVAESISEELSNGVSSNFDVIKQSAAESTIQSNFPLNKPYKSKALNKMRDETPNSDIVESITSNGPMNGLINVKVDMNTAKEIHIPNSKPKIIKENGFHDEDAHINGDIDLDTVSIHSEDSVTSTRSESKRRLRSRQDKKPENPLENAEFLKYYELKQDAIMDENPELSQDEIVAYLYKTWLYEENSKSDDKKNDDLRELNLVKGLNLSPEPKKKTRERDQTKQRSSHKKHSLSLNKNMMQKFLHVKTRGERKMVYTDVDSNFQINDPYSDEIDDVPSPAYEPLDDDIPEISKTFSNSSILNTFVSKETEIALGTSTLIESQEKKEVNTDIEVDKQKDSKVTLTCNEDKKIEKNKEVSPIDPSNAVQVTFPQEPEKSKFNDDCDADSVDSEDSEAPLIRCKLRSKARKETSLKEDVKIKDEEADTISINSENSEKSTTRRKQKILPKNVENALEDPEFVKYLELKQDTLIDENPQLTHDEIVSYLYQTWLYEENNKSEYKKNDDIEQSSLVKGIKDPVKPAKKVKRKIKAEKESEKDEKKETEDSVVQKEKPKRKVIKPYYNEEFSDIEEELEVFSIFKPKIKQISENGEELEEPTDEGNDIDEVELYFEQLAQPKPNVFKGLIREKVCEICEMTVNLVKCKGCNGMFHVDCVNKEEVEIPLPSRGRKKKKKANRKPKTSDEFDNQDDKSQDASEDASIEDIFETEIYTVDADTIEAQLEAKMKELLEGENDKIDYDSYSSDDGCDWSDTKPGKCEIIDIKLKPRRSNETDYSNFKCKNCQKYDTPICFVCKSAVSKESSLRQKCHVAHCHKYYHLKCLDHWPQTQFNGGEPSKTNKKINEYFEALTCPRHVCHTCVSDDPRGCKTRFSGDKLARCVRCPATYHSFTKCLPAGTLILTASHIICPRHYEHKTGKVPCHVNTGWCFICALGGSLICCEYCPTSFHAECLNIKPPEGGYMCEDCETGRLPLYGEMVWVKLGHYRWWPGIILHPTEIPENIMAVKHNPGEFVVRFFGQYDHYWVNRGRVFPFQEGDSGRISNQKSKIDAAFTTAMEHAQRACEILKSAGPNEEESLDIASSLLPPHYVKLRVNKPCGSLCGRKLEDPESSLTQCECNPNDEDPCGPYSQCLNRMLLTECGPTCRAGDRCNNRAFEKRLYPKLVPYRTPSRGWGLKTLEDIKAGQFVIEYVGELIDEQEFRRRMVRKHEIRDENFYFLTLDKERMIDAGPKGNLARFMNHCCEPNCETQKWTVLGDVRVGLFALNDIPANSEVTFNYNLECAGIEKKRCMCGAKRCSGYIGAKPKQDESQSKKPKMPGKRTYKKRKPTEDSPSTKNQPKRPIGRPPKPKELSEIEKDLLIIRNATNGISSDESSRSMSSEYERNPKALKRKRVNFSTEEIILYDGSESPSVKKHKLEEKTDVGD